MRLVAFALVVLNASVAVADKPPDPMTQPAPPPVVHTHRKSQAMRTWGIVLVTVGGTAAVIGAIGSAKGICQMDSLISCDPAGFNWPLGIGLVAVAVGIPMIIIGSKRVPDSPTVSLIPGGAQLTVHF
jgi:hypothetical protein